MGLFSGLPKLPPELMAMMANPQAMGEQVKAFYVAAKELLEAVDNYKVGGDGSIDELSRLEWLIYEKADAFRKEFEKLPSLDKVTK